MASLAETTMASLAETTMTLSTASRTLWAMNPSRMSYRDHGKPHLASFRIRISTLLGPILMTYLSMTVLQEFTYHPAMECATPQSCRVAMSFGHVWFLSLVVGVVACVPSLRAG